MCVCARENVKILFPIAGRHSKKLTPSDRETLSVENVIVVDFEGRKRGKNKMSRILNLHGRGRHRGDT